MISKREYEGQRRRVSHEMRNDMMNCLDSDEVLFAEWSGFCDILRCDDDFDPIGGSPTFDEYNYCPAPDNDSIGEGSFIMGSPFDDYSYRIYRVVDVTQDGYCGVWIGNVFLRPGDAWYPSTPENYTPDWFNYDYERDYNGKPIRRQVHFIPRDEATDIWIDGLNVF